MFSYGQSMVMREKVFNVLLAKKLGVGVINVLVHIISYFNSLLA